MHAEFDECKETDSKLSLQPCLKSHMGNPVYTDHCSEVPDSFIELSQMK